MAKDELFKENEEKKETVKEEPKKEIVETKKELPALDTQIAPGTEQISSDDIQIGRYRLLQSLSTEVESGNSKPGMIIESLSGKEFSTLEIIPLSMMKSRVLFDPENRKGGPLCRSVDEKLEHGSNSPDPASNNECIKCRYSKGFPSQCSLVYNYPCIRPEQVGVEPMPSLLSVMKSSTNAAQKINTFVINSIPRKPFWMYVWEIASKNKPFKKGSAFVFEVKMKRETTQEERKWAESIFNMGLAGKRIEPEWEDE
jgi:hypothetical protein